MIRGNSYYKCSNWYNNSLKDFYSQLDSFGITNGVLMVENLPVPFKGNLLVSMQNFNDTYKYFHPNNDVQFYLKNNIAPYETLKPILKTFIFDIYNFKFKEYK